MLIRVAALFVLPDGPYANRPNVDAWDEARDARKYAGPWPVVAHPPCERWGRYWFGGPSARVRRKLGDDGGCFEAAVKAVERWGGVLEHPEGSHAWRTFHIATPPRSGGWVPAGLFRLGWTCCVEQGGYGHPARKATWLYAVLPGGAKPPELKWGRQPGELARLDDGYHSKAERQAKYVAGRRQSQTGIVQRLSKRQRCLTPPAFADLLISIATA